jgi:hypothetical protein
MLNSPKDKTKPPASTAQIHDGVSRKRFILDGGLNHQVPSTLFAAGRLQVINNS